MTGGPVRLRGLAWDHPRGIGAARASAEAFNASQGDIVVSWDNRPLWKFAYMPLDEMFSAYDVVLFDHPTVGETFGGAPPMARLDDLYEAAWLADLREHTVGPAYDSYVDQGALWALPVDIAVQVAVVDPELLDEGLAAPATWSELVTFAEALRQRGRAIGLPMNYSDAAVNLYTLGAQLSSRDFYVVGHGFQRDALEGALEQLQLLVDCSATETFDKPPVQVVEDMAGGGPLGYIPLQFGYINYSWAGQWPRRLRFVNPPTFSGEPGGSALGGVGIGISASTDHPAEAARYCAYVASGECQAGPYFAGGGQPSHVAAWTDPACDEAANRFFSATRDSVDTAVIRPRRADSPAYFEYQTAIGERLLTAVQRGEPLPTLASELIELDGELSSPAATS